MHERYVARGMAVTPRVLAAKRWSEHIGASSQFRLLIPRGARLADALAGRALSWPSCPQTRQSESTSRATKAAASRRGRW
jgi:hypothetical protein